jgi:hypothetical protein
MIGPVTHHHTNHIMSPVRVEEEPSTCLLYRDLHGKKPETVVEAQGSYLYLDDGRK